MAKEREQNVAALLQEAAETHHRVYRITDGTDDDWASWYAEWLLDLSELPAERAANISHKRCPRREADPQPSRACARAMRQRPHSRRNRRAMAELLRQPPRATVRRHVTALGSPQR
jgi:hypothetical protein